MNLLTTELAEIIEEIPVLYEKVTVNRARCVAPQMVNLSHKKYLNETEAGEQEDKAQA